MIKAYHAGYKTGSGNVMSMTIYGTLVPRDRLPVYDRSVQLLDMCLPCRGQSGGCPPYAPHFSQLKPSCPCLYVVVVAFDNAWAIKYGGRMPDPERVKQSNFFRSGFADRLTVWYTRRLMKAMEDAGGGYGLTAGNCPKCNPSSCTVLQGEVCVYPAERRYSMEAVGVDCSELNDDLFGERLTWWYYTAELPTYMQRYAGLFANDNTAQAHHDLLVAAIEADQSYVPILDCPPVPEYDVTLLKAPDGVYDEGMKYEAYVIT